MMEEFTYASGRRCGISDELMRCHITATTLAITGIVLAAAGAAAGAVSSVQAGKREEAAGKYNAAVGRNNALNAQRAAQFEASRIEKRNRLILGKQRAAYLKSGVDLSGSAEDVILDSMTEGELDILAAKYEGLTASQSFESRARLAEFEGSQARQAGNVAAVGSILSGASRATNTYSSYRRGQDPEF